MCRLILLNKKNWLIKFKDFKAGIQQNTEIDIFQGALWVS